MSSPRHFLESWIADARYALRAFRRSPGFAFGVVLVAGVGIAINSAVFVALNALFLKPLPVADPREMVRVYTSDASGAPYGGSSFPDYLDLRTVPSLNGLAAYAPVAANVRVEGALVRAEGRLVSGNFFEVLRVPVAAGRVFTAGDTTVDGVVPAVLSHAFWKRQFGSDPAIVGRTIDVNDSDVAVVGVCAADFSGIEPSRVDLYVPMAGHGVLSPGSGFADARGARLMKMIGRLATAATPSRAAADLNIVMAGLAKTHPATNADRRVAVTRASALLDTTTTQAPLGAIVSMLFSVTGTLLLIATVNVAGLLLARTMSRRRELAVRLSLGASRGRVLRQLVTESLVLGVAAEAVALGVLVALPAIARSFGIPETVPLGLDARVLAFASLVTLVTSLAFSIGPALRGSTQAPYDSLRHGATTMPLRRARAQRVMVVAQVALSIVLLSGAVLLVRDLRRQYRVDPGFDTAHVLTAWFESVRGADSEEEHHSFVANALRSVRQLPGVISATVSTSPPLTSEGASTTIAIPGVAGTVDIPFSPAGPDYFATFGFRMVQGEELRSGGAAARRAVVVNETAARTYWPGRSPVGATVRRARESLPVIGVVADARMVSLSRPAAPHLYLQSDPPAGSTLMIRTATTAASLKPAVQRMFAEERGGGVLRRLDTMEEILSAALAESRAFAMVTAAVSALALLLAVSALYALVSYLAVQRTREFGIRIALGASRADVLRLVLGSGVRLSVTGALIGLAVALGGVWALRTVLFAVSAADAATVLAAAVVAAGVAIMACVVPALRVASAPPASTLRAE